MTITTIASVRETNYIIEAFTIWLQSWGAAQTTIAIRVNVVRSFARDRDLLAVDRADIEVWLANPSWSGWTRSAYHAHLRSLFGWLRATGRRADDPTYELRRPRTPKSLPRPLTDEQVATALEAAVGPVHTYLLLGLYAGLRSHEIGKVRGEDVSPDGLYVVGKGNKAATLPTHPLIWAAAQDYPRHGWWFPTWSRAGHATASGVTGAVTRLFASLGIEGSVHRCRHTYGTRLVRAGNNLRVVQELMRHESLTTTQVYTEVADAEKRSAIASLAA